MLPTLSSERPLDAIRSIKVKLGLLVVVSVLAAALVAEIGVRAGVPIWLTLPVTVVAALSVTQWLARGMTAPLREMTQAAQAMARGDHELRVTATSADEVGELGRAFNTMAHDLATVDEQRRQLIATVSHELRTPLTAQRALLENLVDGVVRPDDAALGAALAQAERLSALVTDLLDLSRLEDGAVPLALGPVDVRTLLEDAVAETRILGRDVRFVVAVDPPDLVVTGDQARLAQVVANLLDNAARHSPVGGTVTVRAAVAPLEPSGRAVERAWWQLDVVDEGPGIDPERDDEVFRRFGGAAAGVGGGTGLGLAIARWICGLHGGTLAVVPPDEAERGGPGGAHLRGVLPLGPATAAAPPDRKSTSRHSQPYAAHPGPRPGRPRTPRADNQPVRLPADPQEGPIVTTTTPEGPFPAPGPSRPGAAPTPRSTSPATSLVDSLFGDLWAERGMGTELGPQVALFGSLGIGLIASVVLPERNLGLATLVVLLLSGALVLALARHRSRPWTVLSAAVSLGLGSLVVMRAAEWVAVLSLAVVALLVTTALTDARRLVPMVVGAASWVLAGVRGLPLLGRTIAATSRHRVLWPALRTAVISVVALVVFGGLFASADAVFGSWVSHLVPDLAWDSLTLRVFTVVFIAGLVLTACYVALNPPPVERLALPEGRPVRRAWEWLVPVLLIVAVFAGFVAAQTSAMWGGHDYVQRTTGLSYAAYVHEGFGQLTVATVLTLVTIALTARKASRETARDRLWLRIVLGTLCLLTLVVVASALTRMGVYQQAYGFTVLRVLVDAFELWLGFLVALVMVAGIRLRARWLPRAALASAAVLLLGIGLANPEAWVAQRNIDRYEATGRLDTAYLASLGPDATPAILAGLPSGLGSCIATSQRRPGPDDLLAWNLGRARAADVLAATAVTPGGSGRSDCQQLAAP